MDATQKWAYERRIADLVKVLEENEFATAVAKDKEDAKRIVMEMIPEGSTIAEAAA